MSRKGKGLKEVADKIGEVYAKAKHLRIANKIRNIPILG